MTHIEQQAEYQRRATSSARIERLAERLIKEHNLSREWECSDERIDTIAMIVADATRAEGLDECQRGYLSECIKDSL